MSEVTMPGIPNTGGAFGYPATADTPTYDPATHASQSGASAPAVGRLKLADDSTFYGIPFLNPTGAGWGIYPDPSGAGAFTAGTLIYTLPWVFPDAIHITDLHLIASNNPTDVLSAAISDDLRVAIVAADTDWRPTGAPVYQGVVTYGDTVSDGDDLALPVTPFDLPAGRYMVAIQEKFGAGVVTGASIQTTQAYMTGGLLCDGANPSEMFVGLSAAHTYGAFTDPMPAPAVGLVGRSNAATFSNAVLNSPQFPLFFEWDPA